MKFIFPVFTISLFVLTGNAFAQMGAPATTTTPPKSATAPAAPGKPSALAVQNDPTVTTAEFGGWVVRCVRLEGGSEQKLCEALQSVVIEGQGRPLTRIALARGKTANETLVTIVVPHDLTLSTPARIVLNNREQSAELRWVKCLPMGCLADTTVSSAVLAKWRNETENGAISIVSGDGKPVDVPISFRGLSQALNHLSKESF